MLKDNIKKVYFIVEAYRDDEVIGQSDKICALINPETKEEEFSEVFMLDTAIKANNYDSLDDFMVKMVEISADEFNYFNKLMITAVRENDNIFIWGLDIQFDDEECVDIQMLDWLKDGKEFKYI